MIKKVSSFINKWLLVGEQYYIYTGSVTRTDDNDEDALF